MIFNPPGKMLSFEQYGQASDALHALSGMLLFEFARHSETALTRDLIGRNFIARADTMVKGILRLWEIADYADCWILHRALLDRLFHLHDLHKRNQFDVFEDWSFKEQYEAAGRLRGDPELKGYVEELVEKQTPERKARYKNLVNNPPVWRRPKAEDTAKEMDLKFLYRYGYDFASRYVHPMANDGQQEFYQITHLEPTLEFAEPKSTAVLSNSVLIASMIMQEALNASSLSWRRIVYDAVDGVREFLLSASPEHHVALAKVALMFKDNMPLANTKPDPT
jgi:Family of unknown function (DUF5677)